MMRYFLKVFKLLLSLIALLCTTTFLTGCSSFCEDLGDVTEVNRYVTNDLSTVKSVLSRMLNPMKKSAATTTMFQESSMKPHR